MTAFAQPELEAENWLGTFEYLPIEGEHYEPVDVIAKIGDVELDWYGIRIPADS